LVIGISMWLALVLVRLVLLGATNEENICGYDNCDLYRDCHTGDYLSQDNYVIGFNVVCMTLTQSGISSRVFINGNAKSQIEIQEKNWEDWKSKIAYQLELDVPGTNPTNKYPWAMFTPQGSPITLLDQALESKVFFIFKGGYFIWPGISIGHKRELKDISGLGSITMTTLSLQPLIFDLSGFLTLEECNHIRNTALPYLMPSPVSKMDHDIDKEAIHWRTSHNCFLDSDDDPILEGIDQRVMEVTKASIKQQESAQVLRYESGQRYSAHHDFFPPQYYQSKENEGTLAMLDGGRKNRFITVFWYLSDVEEGGETIFPRAGGLPSPTNFNDCTNGLKVTPKEGKAIMFYSMTPEGQFDECSLHGACPVIKGIKWAANKWVWSHPF